MVKKGIVVAADGKLATIETLDDGCCNDCFNSGNNSNCLNCKKRMQESAQRHISVNKIGAIPGDLVEYSKNTFSNLIYALIAFVLPILLTVVTYVAANWITQDDPESGRIALTVLAIAMICVGVYSYKFYKVRCDYKIISKI